MKKNSIKILIILIALIIFIALVGIGYALFSHTRNESKSTRIGRIEVVLHEDWPDNIGDQVQVGTTDQGEPIYETYTETGLEKNSKVVTGENVGDVDAYVRLRCIPIVEYFVPDDQDSETGKWVTAPVAQSGIVLMPNGEKWIKSGDYWYYSEILEPEATTDELYLEWHAAELPNEILRYSIRTNVKVILEYSQTTNDKWKDNFQIESLPEGVEQ